MLSFVDKIEMTTDKNVVNALLEQGWVLIDVVALQEGISVSSGIVQ